MTQYGQGLLSVFEFEKQMIMEYTNGELLDMVERYKTESKIPFNNDVKLGFALFARWLLSQNLQQTPCTTKFTCKTCGEHEKYWNRKNDDWYCKTCGHICR